MTTDVITENTTVQNATEDSKYTGVADNRLDSTDGGSINYGSSNYIEVTKYSVGGHQHAVLRFDGLSNISASASVSAATLYLYQTSSNNAYSIDLRRLLQAWTEAGSTWNTYDGTNNWNTSGALGAGSDRTSTAESTTSTASTTGAYYSFDCTSLVQDVIDGTISSDEGFHLERNDSGDDNTFKAFASSEGTDGQRPELVVVYTTGGGGGIEILRRRIEGY